MRRILLGLLVGAVGYCLIFRAEAQDVHVGTGLVCDTAENVAAVGALFAEKGNQGAIEAVNAKSPDACGVLTVAYVIGATKAQIKVGDRYYNVVEIAVVSIASNGQWNNLNQPVIQHTAIEAEGRPD
jgi:hypothetical protein